MQTGALPAVHFVRRSAFSGSAVSARLQKNRNTGGGADSLTTLYQLIILWATMPYNIQ